MKKLLLLLLVGASLHANVPAVTSINSPGSHVKKVINVKGLLHVYTLCVNKKEFLWTGHRTPPVQIFKRQSTSLTPQKCNY